MLNNWNFYPSVFFLVCQAVHQKYEAALHKNLKEKFVGVLDFNRCLF